jgi:hypothetical protein
VVLDDVYVKLIIYMDDNYSLETIKLLFRSLRTSFLRDLMWKDFARKM